MNTDNNNNNNNENNENNDEFFEITQDKIDVVKKAAQYIKQIDDFAGFVEENFYGHYVIPCYYIMEDFVRSNEHIIQKINKVIPKVN